MPLKLNVGIARKLGQPGYSSLGASCQVEVELDHSLLFDDPDGFHERAKHAFAACRQAVHDELARQQAAGNAQGANGQSRQPGGYPTGPNSHRASQKQLDYAEQLAGQIPGLNVDGLATLAERMFGKTLAELSSLDASGLIDALKDIRAGKIEPADALDRPAA